ncbi:hypothetical protein pb186bvf_002334 [Paramecium bursaria]
MKSNKEQLNKLRMVLEYRQNQKYQPQITELAPEQYKIIKQVNPLEAQSPDIQALFINIKWNHQQGATIEEFQQMVIPETMMSNGILFIWCDKDNIMEIIDHLDTQGFNYVENFTMVILSREKILTMNDKTKKITDFFTKKEQKEQKLNDKQELQLSDLPDLDPSTVFWNQDQSYFRKAKRTLLMFRKISKQNLELRHQRTGDIFFDVVDDPQGISDIGLQYVFQMIETLLPKAKYINGEPLKMMEIFADPKSTGRLGWVQVVKE